MSYLVDTNFLSELRRREPEPRVVEWFADRPATTLFLSVLTLGEVRSFSMALKVLTLRLLARASSRRERPRPARIWRRRWPTLASSA